MTSPRPARRFCLFTSAGARNVVQAWIRQGQERSFDLIVAYYDENDDEFEALERLSDRCFRIKGGKYQNLWNLWQRGDLALTTYDYVWVADDDMRIAPENIERCFALAERFGFWVSSPSHDPAGKISNPFMIRDNGGQDIRIVSYIEVTWPIFHAHKLEQFLNEFDGSLTCWGVDHWWAHVFQTEKNFTSAIFDCISAINTPDSEKGGKREIGRLVSDHDLIVAYEKAKRTYGFVGTRPRVLSRVSLEWDERLTLLGRAAERRPVTRYRRQSDLRANITPSARDAATLDLDAFTQDERALLSKMARNSSNVCLFGATWAIPGAVGEPSNQVVAVAAHQPSLDAVQRDPAVAAANAEGRLDLLHVDLGDVTPLGQPASRTCISNWASFSAAPWPIWLERSAMPDLVIVAGPFRKACCARALAAWIAYGRSSDMVVALRNTRAGTADLAEDLSSLFEVAPSVGTLALLRPRALGEGHGAHLSFLIQRWQLDVR